jgi:hypothetical protein
MKYDYVINNCNDETIFQVVDADGEVIATCVSDTVAIMIVKALNLSN